MGRHVADVTSSELDAPLWEPAGVTGTQAAADPAGLAGPVSPVQVVRRQRLLVPEDFLPKIAEPPATGWRRAAWRAGARRLGPGTQELRQREQARQIRRPMYSPKVIAVMSPKGGVGKSTTAILLGQVLALMRGHLVAALDANPDSGNLVTRVPEPHSPLGAAELHRDAGRMACRSDLVPYLTPSPSGLCVVRSGRETDVRLGPAEYRSLIEVLARFHSIIVVDLGTGIRDPAFLAVIKEADAVVPVTEAVFDAAEVLIEGLDWLSRRFPGIFRTATAVINQAGRRSSGQPTDQIAEALEDRVAQALPVPRDRHLAGCEVPQWAKLGKETQDAYLELAATIIDTLPDEDAAPSDPGETHPDRA